MTPEKRQRLKEAGWAVGNAEDFLELTEKEVVVGLSLLDRVK